MSGFMFDDYEDLPFKNGEEPQRDPHDEELEWELINVYSREDAIKDGVLVPYEFTYQRKKYTACFSCGLYDKYEKYPSALKWIAQESMKRLAFPDPQDTSSRKLRVILEDQILAILDSDGLTFLRPEDY